MSGELTVAIKNGLKKAATKLVDKEEDLAKLEKQLDEAVIEENGKKRKLTQEEKDEILDEIEGKAELTEDAGGIRQRRKTRGNPEDQLSSIGRNIPPLTLEEIQRVLKWQNFRNTVIKEIREWNFSHFKDQELVANLTKVRNNIIDHMTPDDLAGVIKEQRGEVILKSGGIPFEHIVEYKDAMASFKRSYSSIIRQIKYHSDDPQKVKELQGLYRELNKIKDKYNELRIPKKN